jgi:ribonuclease BN (tRNA processing enzyme)
LRSQEAAVLLDLGSGAFSNLREAIDYTALDAILISHMHADHFLDLIPLRYALKYGPLQREGRIALYMPPGGERVLRDLCSAFTPEGPVDFLDEVFVVNEYEMQRPMEINDVRLSFTKTIHYIDAYAMRAESGSAKVVYSSDTAPCDSVINLARDCDLFLCECTLGLGEVDIPRGHVTSAEAGEMARRADVGRLALTHYGSEYAPGELEDEAEVHFQGPCAVVDDGMELSI